MLKRSFGHWTPRYIVDRAKVMLYEKTHPNSPWLCPDAVRILNSWLKATDTGLECGSGRSTIWFARRVAHLISVEHNPDWVDVVRRKLDDAGLTQNVDYNLCKSDLVYVGMVNKLPPKSLDFCLVDGAYRDRCALACLEKLKPGGLLIVDNANWYIPKEPKSHAPNSRGLEDGFASEGWRELAMTIRNWRCIWITSGVTDTVLWIKECFCR